MTATKPKIIRFLAQTGIIPDPRCSIEDLEALLRDEGLDKDFKIAALESHLQAAQAEIEIYKKAIFNEANVTLNFPPLPDSEAIRHLQDQVIAWKKSDMSKEQANAELYSRVRELEAENAVLRTSIERKGEANRSLLNENRSLLQELEALRGVRSAAEELKESYGKDATTKMNAWHKFLDALAAAKGGNVHGRDDKTGR